MKLTLIEFYLTFVEFVLQKKGRKRKSIVLRLFSRSK